LDDEDKDESQDDAHDDDDAWILLFEIGCFLFCVFVFDLIDKMRFILFVTFLPYIIFPLHF
jgi:hypothetical protein